MKRKQQQQRFFGEGDLIKVFCADAFALEGSQRWLNNSAANLIMSSEMFSGGLNTCKL